MSRNALWLGVCILLLVASVACSRPENKQPATPSTSSTEAAKASPDGAPADVVEASATELELTGGSSADAIVAVKVKPGFHINGNPSSSKYQIATALEVEANGGVTPGKATYPPSLTKTFSFSPDPIKVYEGEVVIKQALSAEPGAAKGSQTLRGRLRVQPCDDAVCYPPRTLEVSIPINVK